MPAQSHTSPSAPEHSITSMDFYRAVRMLDAAHPDLPRTGEAYTPAQESIRFGQKPELTFPASPIDSFESGDDTKPPRLNINFLGLFGPNGPLPLHLTEHARNRGRHHSDRTFSAFCDIFHHRMIALFYRAWMVNQLTADLDRPDQQTFGHYIGSFFGSSATHAADVATTDTIPLNAKLYFTGRLSCPTRNIEGLESIVSEFFSVPATIETHTGRWIPLPHDCYCALGGTSTDSTLGQNAIIGTRVWDTQLSFRLHLGPMRYVDYKRMLPRGESFRRLHHWILNYAGAELWWDVRLILRADEVPMLRLGEHGGQQLGWTTWLHSAQPTRDCGHLLVTPKN